MVVLAWFGASLLTMPALVAAAPAESWRCIAGVCVGHTRATVDARYGSAAREIPSRRIRVPGGRVWACFWRCTNAVTEDGFTYYGGTVRPSNRLVTVGTCDSVFRLPDGTTKGTSTPLRERWNGYRTTWLEGGQLGWRKIVRRAGHATEVVLSSREGRIQCVWLEAA